MYICIHTYVYIYIDAYKYIYIHILIQHRGYVLNLHIAYMTMEACSEVGLPRI